MQPAAFLCVICVICGRIHARVLNLLAYMNPQYLPQIPLIYADNTQNRKTTLTIPTSLCLRNNAACCIRLRHLRDLRENNMQAYSINQRDNTHASILIYKIHLIAFRQIMQIAIYIMEKLTCFIFAFSRFIYYFDRQIQSVLKYQHFVCY